MIVKVIGSSNPKQVAVALLTILCITACSKNEDFVENGPPVAGKAEVWVTSGDKSKLLSKEADIILTASAFSSYPTITIDTTQLLQEIDGFGAALTGSSAYLIHQMTSSQRTALLRDLFDPATGIGITYLRLTMGASDFSLSDYSYDDMPAGETDYELTQFSLSGDLDDVVPVLKQIVAIAPEIKIMSSPWSPPAWMKTNGSMKGGKLSTAAYDVYARYFVKYIKAYQAQGITIDAVTPQNEPLYATATYPCMEMQPGEQADFIKNNLGPEFQSAAIEAKIIAYDHNWDRADYPIHVLNDATARQYIAGSAFHAYGGNVAAMTTVHDAHPDKGLYFTEISGGAWATNFSDNLMWNMQNIFIGTTKNWSRNALLWNLALDQNHGPTNNGCGNCRGVVTINGMAVTKNEEYYSIGHFSKFIRYGAHRVQSTEFNASIGLISVAFMNADDSKVLIVANSNDKARGFTITQGNRQFNYIIAAKSVASIKWK